MRLLNSYRFGSGYAQVAITTNWDDDSAEDGEFTFDIKSLASLTTVIVEYPDGSLDTQIAVDSGGDLTFTVAADSGIFDGTDRIFKLIYPDITKTIGQIEISSKKIKGTIDLSQFTIIGYLFASDNPELTHVNYGSIAFNTNSTWAVNLRDTGLNQAQDFSQVSFGGLSGDRRLYLDNLPNLPDVLLPSQANVGVNVFTDLYINSTGVTGNPYKTSDLKKFKNLRFQSTSILHLDLTDVESYTGLFVNSSTIQSISFSDAVTVNNLWILWADSTSSLAGHLDFSNHNFGSGSRRIWANNWSVTQLTFPTGSNASQANISIAVGGQLGGDVGGIFDLSMFDNLSSFSHANDTSITEYTLPSNNVRAYNFQINTGTVNTLTNLDSQNVMANTNNWRFSVNDHAMSASEVNTILQDLDSAIDAVYSYSGCVIDLSGTNAAPTGLGITARDNLIARGITVTVTA